MCIRGQSAGKASKEGLFSHFMKNPQRLHAKLHTFLMIWMKI